ncbi:hypothetical protein [Agrobacterium tumefaciens]|uniref:hypothetical protein n=1 Tax=Agrobacterium tumefaciens TaxID=358 RepID=UPI003BA2A771
MIDQAELIRDLSLFADLGTEAPLLAPMADGFTVAFFRDGQTVELLFRDSGDVVETCDGKKTAHRSLKALLASPLFADLGRWADGQVMQLQQRALNENIPIHGRLSTSGEAGTIDLLDDAISVGETISPKVLVTLIDGPAGIGKTALLRQLAYRRALNYRLDQKPLLLHVESRGRMLQNLTDLMAFSLQTLRLRVTYDQIPVLVRYGLVTLAIDGFDELGDPSGYDLAWAQVNELVNTSRGRGSLILAGRETFIGEGRMKGALTALDESVDRLQTFSLLPPSVDIAKAWLSDNGWTSDNFQRQEVQALFEDGSYALRPFFLKELTQEGIAARISGGVVGDLLQFLIDTMIDRETKKFGEDIEAATTHEQRCVFLKTFLEEVSRDMADNQTDAIPGDTLGWIAEVVASDNVSPSLSGVLKNRASVVAFLTVDERRGYRRFSDGQIGNYFLSQATVKAVSGGEIPKYVRRNIFGLEFLENFCSAVRMTSQVQIDNFVDAAVDHIEKASDYDRSRRNLAALILALKSVCETSDSTVISNVSIDDAYVTETVSKIILRNVTIAQLFARSTDLRQLEYQEHGVIVSLIADGGTIPPNKFPMPSYVILPDRTLVEQKEKSDWVGSQFLSKLDAVSLPFAEILSRFPIFTLLHKFARTRSYWIKEDEDKASRRIFEDENWLELKEKLLAYDLLLISENVGAGGRPGTFYHLRNKQGLLSFDDPPVAVRPFLTDLLITSYKKAQAVDESLH